ncbi:Tll0287-like domain-containing protein [Congregibacter sp.]|uniref:Tll0287-like domain-containing protein n=1 Tax=Congregibacter sp. TaxID=2744308 RepID=UPI003F6A6DA7
MKILPAYRAPLACIFTVVFALGAGNTGAQNTDQSVSYIEQGREIALLAKKELGGQLQQAMGRGGPVAAVEFCNEKALPITSAVSAKAGASVSRVSDRPRNPANTANDLELAYIADAKANLAQGLPVKPVVRDTDGKQVGFYPIVTGGVCLQCHGDENTQISTETLSVIDALYPDDKATGYGLNELRGIFVVSMQNR